MMKTFTKYLLGAGAAGIGALAAIIVIPGLVGESQGEPTTEVNFVAPATAEIQHLAQADVPQPAPPSSLPGGATSVQETHQDWQVTCGQQGDVKRCSMTQQQHNAQTRQRVLAIEFQPTSEGLAGALVLPFGLSLDRGITLQIDDAAPQNPLRFSTCLPAGCVVPLTFDAAGAQTLAQGGALKINAVAEGGQDLTMSVSLKGFAAAHSRIVELAK